MTFLKNLKNSAKELPKPLWIAGMVIPGGLTAIVVYLAWRSSKEPDKTLRERIDQLLQDHKQQEKDNRNDRSKDRR